MKIKKSENVFIDKIDERKIFDWSDKYVLVAEDEEMNYKFIEEVLKRTRINVIHAKDGKEAIEMAKDNKIDVVLMDIKMPLLNGYEATKRIKKLKQVPVIALTAYAMAGEREKSIEAGCDDYISKPIIVNQLFSLLRKYLEEKL